MKPNLFFYLSAITVCLFGLAACSAAPATPSVPATTLPFTATATENPPRTLTPTAAPSLSPTPTRVAPTRTPEPESAMAITQPPEGVFVLKFYPPLVMDFDLERWSDPSQYENTEQMVNFLQHKTLETCTISVRGPSGFYPDNMKTVRLGTIDYQVFTGDRLFSGKVMSDYFFAGSTGEPVESEAGIPILDVSAVPAEMDECAADAEEVLANLRGPK